jgi:hypothetical protein
MRDDLMKLEYYNDFIERDGRRIESFKSMIANGEVSDERILPVKTKIHDLRLGLLIAGYSRGDDLECLQKEYFSLLEGWENVFVGDFYNKGLRMLSLGVLFNADKMTLKNYYEMYKTFGVEDWLYEFLVSDGAHPESIISNLRFPDAYEKLKRTILKEDANSEDIKVYLKDWYKNHRSCGWYDSHKSKQMTYHGYWSFEAGAVVKLLQIDDTDLNGGKYYPFDLVHY